MRTSSSLRSDIQRALCRAKFGILTVGIAYVLALGIGLAMVHAGNSFALAYSDRIVANASASSSILHALHQGHPLVAAGLDFGANSLGGLASTLAGYWAPAVYPVAIYRGWIGGIVSVDRRHRSRLENPSDRRYYLITVFLQLVPYILAGGAGVNLGIARVRPVGDYAGPKWFGVPQEAFKDGARMYLLVIPLFALASAYEFLAIPT
jgi:hypothetical protein